jgi:hypothetical protein
MCCWEPAYAGTQLGLFATAFGGSGTPAGLKQAVTTEELECVWLVSPPCLMYVVLVVTSKVTVKP